MVWWRTSQFWVIYKVWGWKIITTKKVEVEFLKENNLTSLEIIEKHLDDEIIMNEELKHYCLFFLKEELEKLRDEDWIRLTSTPEDRLF